MIFSCWQLSHQLIAPHVTSKLDQHALSFLEDIELKQDVNDFRPYELVFVRGCECAWESITVDLLFFFFFAIALQGEPILYEQDAF